MAFLQHVWFYKYENDTNIGHLCRYIFKTKSTQNALPEIKINKERSQSSYYKNNQLQKLLHNLLPIVCYTLKILACYWRIHKIT